jgi:hypothetical protein
MLGCFHFGFCDGIKSGFDVLAFSTASMPSLALVPWAESEESQFTCRLFVCGGQENLFIAEVRQLLLTPEWPE